MLPHNDLRKNGETRHEEKKIGLPVFQNSQVRSIHMVTDAKPSGEFSRKSSFVA
ncbi:MAG: hypothetical protein ACJZ7A_05790 [Opitutales bacterium]